ncbi:MAG TPA: superoxide dismutase family protein [Kofleriaceae bacterium]|nr:superoxide dismutase family protein [Kofleriaceae bacterium]
MRTTATLLLLTALGCGGASESSREQTTPTAAAAPEAEPAAPEETATAAAPTPASDGAPAAAATPAAAPAAAPAEGVARAELKTVTGDKSLGTMTFQKSGNTVTIEGQFSGHKKGQHALYIHDKGDCSDKGRKVGGHLNPTKAKHGPPASSMRHAGDFGDVTFDKDGNATFSMTTDSITLEPGGADSVVGRAVVLHARKDNPKGSAGAPIACGVVMLEGGGTSAEARQSYTGEKADAPTASSK